MAKKKSGKLRVAVVGIGAMGTGHCVTIKKKVPEMTLVAVCDNNPAALEKATKDSKVPGFSSWQKLVKANLCDAVIVSTPHPAHPEITIGCLKAGLNVLCEKPLSERISTAEKMVTAAKKYKKTLAVMFQRRFEGEVSAAIDLVRSGKLGKLHRVTLISPEYRSQAYYDSGGWRATWNGEGGGVMMNQSPHIMDIFVNLVGLPAKVRGNVQTKLHRIEVEDFAEATMSFKDGGAGYFYCSTNETGPGQMIELFCDKGKLLFRDGEMKAWLYNTPLTAFTMKNKAMWGRPELKELKLKIKKAAHGHHQVMRNFARHLLQGEALNVKGETALASLELANAITLSSSLGEEIKLPISRGQYDNMLKDLRQKSTFKKKVDKKVRSVTDPDH